MSIEKPSKITRPLYRQIAETLQAIKNCEKSNNIEWRDRHEETLDTLLDHMPSGSGIDNGCKLDRDGSTRTKLVFDCAYHHMNEHGMYDGWTDHTVTVTPSFQGIEMKISGKDRNDIKDYLHETLHYALTQEIELK